MSDDSFVHTFRDGIKRHAVRWVNQDRSPGGIVAKTAAIHPSAIVREGAEVLSGALISQDCTLAGSVTVGEQAEIAAGADIGVGATICSLARLGLNARVGRNTFVGHRAHIEDNVEIGEHVHMGHHTSVYKESVIEDFVRLADKAMVSRKTHLGPGSAVLQRAYIGPGVVVPAGLCVPPMAQLKEGEWFRSVGPLGPRRVMALAVKTPEGLRWWVGGLLGLSSDQLIDAIQQDDDWQNDVRETASVVRQAEAESIQHTPHQQEPHHA